MMRAPIPLIVAVLQFALIIHASQKIASLYSSVNQLVTSSTLIWQTFNGDIKDLEFAVQASKYVSESENYTQYICRASVEGIVVPGNTLNRDQRVVCVVSMHEDVRTHHSFEILLNRNLASNISWKPWNKYNATIPAGAVSATSAGHVSFSVGDFVKIYCLNLNYNHNNHRLD